MVANTELQRVGLSGWRTGLANLLGKENRTWWASRRWLVQSVLWVVILDGLTALWMFVIPAVAEAKGQSGLDGLTIGVQLLFDLGCTMLAIGAIVLVQGEILGERQLGVTEWVLSKPVSRQAYVLSKLLAHGFGVLALVVALPGAVGYGMASLKMGGPYPPLPYLVSMAGLAVHTLLYLALALMMGVLTANRNTLLGVSLGVLLGGSLIVGSGLLGGLTWFTPWGLGKLLAFSVVGEPLPISIWVPIGITAILSVTFVAVALARFERLEF